MGSVPSHSIGLTEDSPGNYSWPNATTDSIVSVTIALGSWVTSGIGGQLLTVFQQKSRGQPRDLTNIFHSETRSLHCHHDLGDRPSPSPIPPDQFYKIGLASSIPLSDRECICISFHDEWCDSPHCLPFLLHSADFMHLATLFRRGNTNTTSSLHAGPIVAALEDATNDRTRRRSI
ncbi:hypothetical protein K474DRAFT_1663222, partial [Panus rudis PR-1116 ss-1]